MYQTTFCCSRDILGVVNEQQMEKRPRRYIFLKVSREGYTGTAHPACCVARTLGPYVSAVSTLPDNFR
jgi:hypothetical protein